MLRWTHDRAVGFFGPVYTEIVRSTATTILQDEERKKQPREAGGPLAEHVRRTGFGLVWAVPVASGQRSEVLVARELITWRPSWESFLPV